jgi:hypothetical protein
MSREPEVLSIEQVLILLPGFTEWSLRNMIRRNQIPYRKRGRRIVFLKSELMQWSEHLPGVGVAQALNKSS